MTYEPLRLHTREPERVGVQYHPQFWKRLRALLPDEVAEERWRWWTSAYVMERLNNKFPPQLVATVALIDHGNLDFFDGVALLHTNASRLMRDMRKIRCAAKEYYSYSSDKKYIIK